MHCTDDLSIAISKNLKFGLFSPDVSPLIYYSHFIAIVIAIMLCVILIKNIRKNNLSYTLVVMMGVFVFMALLDLLLWTQTNSKVIMFLWSTWILSFTAIFLLCFNFIFKFTNRRIIAVVEFIFVPIFFVVIALLSVTEGNLQYFDINACAAAENSVMIGTVFIISFIFLTIIMLRGISCFGYEDIEQKQRRVGLFIAIGLGLFLLVFAGSSYYASLANFFGAEPDTFMLEQYAYFGMPILGIFLTFVIVRYKAFDIKLLATQALIWTLIILVGSQFFFIRNPINYVLNGITFVGAIISGVLIVRSVKRVDAQREELALANQEQETLVHFITHQIKGYFTKSRNIFDTLTDMENVPEGAQRLISEGLRSDKEGVELVENILNAANLKTGKMQFKDEKGSLDQMIKKLVDDMTPLATAKI